MKRIFTLMITAIMLMMTSLVWGQTRDEASITFSEQGYSNGQSLDGITIDLDNNITIQFDKNTGNTAPAYYNTGTAARLYGGNTLTITPASGCSITGMTLTFSSTSNVGTLSASTGTYSLSSTTGTWTGSSSAPIVITNTASSGHARLKILSVTYSNSGAPSVATPTFSPAAGTYSEAQNVTISCTTTGATIYYTTDGTTPTTSSSVYSTPIAISTTTTVKAMAVKTGMTNSSVASATYTIQAAPTVITIAAARALANNEYALVQGVVTFIDGTNIYVQDATAGIDLYLNTGTVPAGLDLGDMVQAYGKKDVYKGLVELKGINGGNATQFQVLSTGNTLPLAEKTIAEILADHNGDKILQSTRVQIVDATIGTINTSNNTPITQGESTMNIYKIPALDGIAAGDAIDVVGVVGCYNNPQLRVAFAADVVLHQTQIDTVETPTFTPIAGTYNEAQDVTISTTTEGATIYYTLDGTTPTINSSVYSTAITISETTTVKAFAVKADMIDSEVATAEYTINIVPPTPTVTFHKLANHTDVTSDGIYMIVDVNGGYALTSTNGTASAPAAVAVTIEGDSITGQIEAALQWRFKAADGGYTINPLNDSLVYLYTTATNNGVRVGTNANNVWELNITGSSTQNYHGFKNVATQRYIGVYTSTPDWRAYTSINNNIKDTQIEIFVLGDAPVPPTPTEDVATPTFEPAAGSYISIQSVSLACATEGATIYYTTDGTEPTIESTVYAEPFTVNTTTTVKAFAVKEGMNNSAVATAEYTIITQMAIADARALAVNEYALVKGVVTFIDGRNVYVQDATAGIDLYLNNNTVPTTLAIGDMVKAYGKIAVYNGLVELSSINGGNENQFLVLSSGNPLPLAVKTIAEILEDAAGDNMLQSTRVKIVDAVCGTINTASNTPIAQGESTLNIYKMPVVTGLTEGDIMTVIGVIGCHNAPQLRVNSADDVTFTHPAGINVNPTALSGFNYVYEEGPSTVKTFNISAIGLSATTYIHASENYEISSFPGESFYPESMITINTYTGVYNYTIKVRLKAGLEIGEYNESIMICEEELDTMYIALSGNVTSTPPQPQGDYTRVSDLSQLTSGSKVIFAARFDENADQYYAMTAQASGKPEGVLFTSIPDNNSETLPAEITDAEDTFYWTVEVDGDNYTFTNANGDVLGYNSSTNFATGGDNTAWAITFQTSEATAMVPEYSAFVINNVNTPVRAFALNSNHNFGPYHTQNMDADNYNFFIDMFATVGGGTLTCATPTFTPEAGTYFEEQTVAIACTTVDATIYYTTDGTDPDENSSVYSEPVTVAENMTIKAIAMKEGYENSNIATAEYTIILGAVTIFEQDWEGDMNGWTFVTVEGGNAWTVAQYSGNHYAYANGYNGGVNEQWCISPAFSLDVYSNVSLNFRNAKNYTGPDMQLFFTNDYDGSDPTAATWVELEFVKSTGSYTWTESGAIDLASFTGDECYIGFKYTSTETEAAAWEVDDITLMGFTSAAVLTVSPTTLTGFNYIEGNGPSAEQTISITGFNLTETVTVVNPGTDFDISLTSGDDFDPQLGIYLTPVNGSVDQTIYVRLQAGLPIGEHVGTLIVDSELDDIFVELSGNVTEQPIPGGDWNRILSLSDLEDGDQVIIASRYDATVGDGYYAMPAVVSGKPDGVLFTSVNDGGVEKLPAEIADDADTYKWTVTVDADVITLTNAAGDTLGYSSSTNFAGNVNTEWNIALETSEEGAMIPNYTGFVITNGTTTNRGIAKNASNKFGAYSTSNIASADYNFFMDLFVYGGSVTPTVATPVFSMPSGTYYEAIEVEIACATEGATIYYTTDGSDPTAESVVYAEPIVVESDMTIKAIAMMEGFDNSAIATASYVIMGEVVVVLSQDWEGEMDGWTFVTIEGNKPWVIGTYNNNHYANANGYGDDVDNEQWCISPAFDLSGRDERNVTLTFKNATKFNGPALELYISEDYDGQDPTAATWEPLEYIASEGNYVWTESGEISLNDFHGESCYIGFRYISTIDEGAASWEIDDILIVADKIDNVITHEASLNVEVWNNYNALMISNDSGSTLDVVVYNLVGQPVLSETIATGTSTIRHDLVEGVYIVRVANGKEMTGVKVVVTR